MPTDMVLISQLLLSRYGNQPLGVSIAPSCQQCRNHLVAFRRCHRHHRHSRYCYTKLPKRRFRLQNLSQRIWMEQ